MVWREAWQGKLWIHVMDLLRYSYKLPEETHLLCAVTNHSRCFSFKLFTPCYSMSYKIKGRCGIDLNQNQQAKSYRMWFYYPNWTAWTTRPWSVVATNVMIFVQMYIILSFISCYCLKFLSLWSCFLSTIVGLLFTSDDNCTNYSWDTGNYKTRYILL